MPAHPNTHTSTAVQALPAPVVVMQAMMAKSSLIRASWRQAGAQASRKPPLIPKGSTGGLKCRDIGSLQARRPNPALQLAFLNAPLLNGLNGAADINGGYACDPVRCPGASRLTEIMSDTSAHSAAAIARLTERVTSILEPAQQCGPELPVNYP